MKWVLLVVVVLFIGVVTYLFVRDQQATHRCEALGGVTWDSGRHCLLGGTVVSTR